MKKLFTNVFAVVLAVGAFAQDKSNSTPIETFRSDYFFLNFSDKSGDTLLLTATDRGPCSDSIFFVYSWQNQQGQSQGYISGTNDFGDKAIAQRIQFNGSADVLAVITFLVGSGGNNVITSKIYSGTNTPTTLLGTSAPLPFSQLTPLPDAQQISFPFATPPTVDGTFWAAIDYSTAQGADEVAVLTTRIDCGGTDVFALESNNQWVGIHTYQVALDLAVFAVVVTKDNTSVAEFVGKDINAVAFPNPANGSTNINYNIKNDGNVTIKLFDTNGRVVINHNDGFKATGEYTTTIDLNSVKAGSYIYTIETTGIQAVGKLMVK